MLLRLRFFHRDFREVPGLQRAGFCQGCPLCGTSYRSAGLLRYLYQKTNSSELLELIFFAGTPAYVEFSSLQSLTTTAPAPTATLSAIFTLPIILHPEPKNTLLPIIGALMPHDAPTVPPHEYVNSDQFLLYYLFVYMNDVLSTILYHMYLAQSISLI